jgi:hypothetical protein
MSGGRFLVTRSFVADLIPGVMAVPVGARAQNRRVALVRK